MTRFILIAIDDDVSAPLPTEPKGERGQRNQSRDFWLTHAAYWRERGNEAKAQECEREARNAR